MLTWYKKLYVGDTAKKKKDKITTEGEPQEAAVRGVSYYAGV